MTTDTITAPRGAADIAAERTRQVAQLGWTPEHDDEHADGELRYAALCYLRHAIDFEGTEEAYLACPPLAGWPWENKWWKPRNRRRDLVRAGALYQAEVDRLARKGARSRHLALKVDLCAGLIDRIDRGEALS